MYAECMSNVCGVYAECMWSVCRVYARSIQTVYKRYIKTNEVHNFVNNRKLFYVKEICSIILKKNSIYYLNKDIFFTFVPYLFIS
jgi:protein tyrosine/serine phosphatase